MLEANERRKAMRSARIQGCCAMCHPMKAREGLRWGERHRSSSEWGLIVDDLLTLPGVGVAMKITMWGGSGDFRYDKVACRPGVLHDALRWT